ncbi:MAG: DUF1566 domain-containing protein [Bacteroidales bacterium]|nr:DUF1566 domain-containing protein [Bacteroidales bacterium]
MKRILNTLLISAVSVLAFSCQEMPDIDMASNESIVLDISSGLTKAADTDVESFVSHLDVIIFDIDGTVPGNKVYSGRYNVNNASSVTLNAKRSSFPAGSRYYVYLIANSTLPDADFTAVTTYNDLVDKKQEDYDLHLTGLTVEGAPKYFLMDAVAEDADGASPVVLNNGVLSDNTVLSALLTRAAAKVVVNIKASEKVEFKNFTVAEGSEGGLYYLRNMPYDAYLLAEAREDEDIRTAKVRNTSKTNNAYFTWNPSADSRNVSLTTYVYPNNWADNSILERETSIVVNLPMIFTSDGTSTDYKNSWYKIPMTDEKMFRRNNYYEVNIDLNRPGAATETVPEELKDIYYSVTEWTVQDIFVGGDDRPKYLSVNKESMDMHNIAVDATTLEFASSSPVTVTVKDIYYYDKFGQKTPVSPDITGTTDGGIAGNITVNSPVPTNNAIRYFTLVVTNQEGITREVAVAQYPLEYITNQQGWYSYRSDFYTGTYAPTTYEYKGSRRVAADWSNNSWNYSTSVQNNYFFGSKVARMNDDGTSRLYYYSWSQYGSTVNTNAGNLTSLDNARMYHVQITSSSGKYTIGIPKQDANGFTDDGEDNAELVSPSFMIASQLGATQPPTSVEQAERHCREYVEVHDPDNNPDTDNAIHYDNWRLPTAAEIQIIIDFQYAENAAMDEVLSGPYYWSATGQVNNPGSGDDGTQSAVRCIRDVY